MPLSYATVIHIRANAGTLASASIDDRYCYL